MPSVYCSYYSEEEKIMLLQILQGLYTPLWYCFLCPGEDRMTLLLILQGLYNFSGDIVPNMQVWEKIILLPILQGVYNSV